MRTLIALATLLVSTVALGAPLPARSGQTVRIAIAGHRQKGIGLRADSGGWRLALAGCDEAQLAEVSDVTDGATPSKWRVYVAGGALRFSAPRFLPGHAYRVELRSGQTGFIYLYPPAGKSARQRMIFSDEDAATDPAPAGVTDDGIAIAPKGVL